MLGRLILLFVFLPLAELALLLVLADRLSWQFTLGLVVLTGVLGASLARWQGWRTYLRIQDELAAARIPTEPLLDAGMILVAGVLLLTPGIITDAFGFSLLIPPCRRWYRHVLAGWMRRSFHVETYRSPGPTWDRGGRGAAATRDPTGGDRIIDAHVVHREPQDSPPNVP